MNLLTYYFSEDDMKHLSQELTEHNIKSNSRICFHTHAADSVYFIAHGIARILTDSDVDHDGSGNGAASRRAPSNSSALDHDALEMEMACGVEQDGGGLEDLDGNEVLLSAGCCFNDVEFLLQDAGIDAVNFGHLITVTHVRYFRLKFQDLREKPQQYHAFLEKVWRLSGHALCLRFPQLLNHLPPEGWDWDTVTLSEFKHGAPLVLASCVFLVHGDIKEQRQGATEGDKAADYVHRCLSFLSPSKGALFTVASDTCKVLSRGDITVTKSASRWLSRQASMVSMKSRVERRAQELSRPMTGFNRRTMSVRDPDSPFALLQDNDARGARHLRGDAAPSGGASVALGTKRSSSVPGILPVSITSVVSTQHQVGGGEIGGESGDGGAGIAGMHSLPVCTLAAGIERGQALSEASVSSSRQNGSNLRTSEMAVQQQALDCAPSNSADGGPKHAEGRVRELMKLLSQGLITQSECDAHKAAILSYVDKDAGQGIVELNKLLQMELVSPEEYAAHKAVIIASV